MAAETEGATIAAGDFRIETAPYPGACRRDPANATFRTFRGELLGRCGFSRTQRILNAFVTREATS